MRQCPEEQFPQQPTANRYGINVNKLYQYAPFDSTPEAAYGQIATALREANVGWVRMDFDWGRLIAIESFKSDTSQIDWGPMDRNVNRALCRGLNVLGNLAYTPAWAVRRFDPPMYNIDGDIGGGPYPGTHMDSRDGAPMMDKHRLSPDLAATWQSFVRAAVSRYPQIRHWSIWNEPDSPNYFYGGAPGDTSLANIVSSYSWLVAGAAPWIRSNPDGQGPRKLVAVEGAGSSRGDEFMRRVLVDQHANVDVVAVHRYGLATDIVNYVRGLAGSGALGPWQGEVWLTETGLGGCMDMPSYADRRDSGYCTGVSYGHIDDAYQASHIHAVYSGMLASPASTRWAKTFYFHSHAEVFSDTVGNDYGITIGAHTGAVRSRPAYTALAALAGPLAVSGGTYGSNQNVTVTAAPAVAPPATKPYYYEWEYRWCSTGTAAWDCDEQWYAYTSGSASSISPYVDQTDQYVDARVRQYGWQGGPHIGSGSWRIFGPGQPPCGSAVLCDGGSGLSAAQADPDDSAAPTSKSRPQRRLGLERRKGIGHAGNR